VVGGGLTSDGQPGAPGNKLQEEPLLLGVEAAEHIEQEAHGAAAPETHDTAL